MPQLLKRKIIAEYIFDIEDVPQTVKSRISHAENSEFPYMWEISHHYRPTKDSGGVYYPSQILAETQERAESLIEHYVSGFVNIDVTKNKDY